MRPSCCICRSPPRHVFDLHAGRHGIEVPVYLCGGCEAYWSEGGPVSYDHDLTGSYIAHAGPIRSRYQRLLAHLEAMKRLGRRYDNRLFLAVGLDDGCHHFVRA